MRALPILLLAACSSGSGSWNGLDDAKIAELEVALESARAEQNLPGLAMAVATPDDVWVGTTGLADTATDRAWAHDDLFRIGSVTKTFTTAAILQLADEGALTLDDPVQQWVPGYWQGPTIADLLGHSSGIASYNYIGNFDGSAQWTPTELVEWAWDLEPELHFEPGTDWEYSNTNYVLLGLIIEGATGQSYEAVVSERFTGPLGLDATRIAQAGEQPEALVHSYDELGQDITWNQDASMGWAAGGGESTPEQLARWTVALHGGDVLSDERHAYMVLPAGLTGQGESDYGRGAFYESDGELTIYGHTGGIAGFQTYAYYLEQHEVALVVMSNQAPSDLRAASTWGWAAILGL